MPVLLLAVAALVALARTAGAVSANLDDKPVYAPFPQHFHANISIVAHLIDKVRYFIPGGGRLVCVFCQLTGSSVAGAL